MIAFMPTGMVQLSGKKTHTYAGRTQWIPQYVHHPSFYDITLEAVSQIREKILHSEIIKHFPKTKTSEEKGRWLIETTAFKQYNT